MSFLTPDTLSTIQDVSMMVKMEAVAEDAYTELAQVSPIPALTRTTRLRSLSRRRWPARLSADPWMYGCSKCVGEGRELVRRLWRLFLLVERWEMGLERVSWELCHVSLC